MLARCAASLCAIFEALARAGEAAPRSLFLLGAAGLMMKFCKNLDGPCPYLPTYLPTYLTYGKQKIIHGMGEGGVLYRLK